MKNIIRRVLLCFPLVLLMSHNVSAYDFVGNGQFNSNCVNNKTYINSYGNSYGSTCRVDGNGAEINLDSPSVIEYNWLGVGWNGNVPANSLYSFTVSFRPVNGTFQNLNFGGGGDGLLNVDNLGGGTYLFTYYTSSAKSSANIANGNIFAAIDGDVRIYFSSVSYVQLGTPVSSADIAQLGSYLADISSNTYLSAVREQYIINILNDNISANVAIAGQRLQYILDALGDLGDQIDDLPQNTADAVTETEKEKVQDSADEAQAGADDAKNDSQQATSSLLNTVTGIFNAIINANATNCKFDSHLPFMRGNGEIDLCAIPAPPIVQGIGSLIALGLFAPFALHMFRRFVSITESFQR